MTTNQINFNARLTPSIQPEPPLAPPQGYTKERVAKAFLPLIVIVGPVGRAFELIGGVVALYESVTSDDSRAYKALKISFHTASLGLLIINPLAVSISQNIWEAAVKTNELRKCLFAGEYRQAAIHGLKVSEKVVFIASIVIGGPELVLIAMVAQTSLETYRAYHYKQKGMTLEASVQVLVIGIRGYGVYKHVEENKDLLIRSMKRIARLFQPGTVNPMCMTIGATSEEVALIFLKYAKDGSSTSCVFNAAKANDLESVKKLLEYGADPTKALSGAINGKHESIIKYLVEVEKVPIDISEWWKNWIDTCWWDGLDYLIKKGGKIPDLDYVPIDFKYLEVFKGLIKRGASYATPFAGGAFFKRFFQLNLSPDGREEFLSVFNLKSKIPVNKEEVFKIGNSNVKLTPLAYAVRRGEYGTVKELLRLGADPNLQSNKTYPIQLAKQYCDENMISLLIKNGAKILNF